VKWVLIIQIIILFKEHRVVIYILAKCWHSYTHTHAHTLARCTHSLVNVKNILKNHNHRYTYHHAHADAIPSSTSPVPIPAAAPPPPPPPPPPGPPMNFQLATSSFCTHSSACLQGTPDTARRVTGCHSTHETRVTNALDDVTGNILLATS
jgi:hypothetical protein